MDGWEGIQQQASVKPIALTQDEICIAKIFKGEFGPTALSALARLTVDKPTLQAIQSDGINTTIAMSLREGENNLYRKILSIIKKVDNVART